MAKDTVRKIVEHARRTGADPYTMVATAMVESGLNPRAVGDGGTSFGLYQHHIGGAGGRTRASAQRFHNPDVSIEERARAFKGGRGGRFAAGVQRPADAAGYARKVDAKIAELRRRGLGGDLGPVDLNAPVVSSGKSKLGMGLRGGSTSSTAGVGSPGRTAALSMIFSDSPVIQMALARKAARQAEAADSSATDLGVSPAPGVVSGAGHKGGGSATGPLPKGFKEILWEGDHLHVAGPPLAKLLQLEKRFGLKRDAGNSQTTGGRHAPNSYHYKGAAIDWGNAKNPVSKLRRVERILRSGRY